MSWESGLLVLGDRDALDRGWRSTWAAVVKERDEARQALSAARAALKKIGARRCLAPDYCGGLKAAPCATCIARNALEGKVETI